MTSKAQTPKAMKLIVKKDNKLEINNEGLNMLRSIDNYLAICVCIGPYRQGKSFLLNQIAGSSNEFQVGHKDDACTEGVWINKHSFEKKKFTFRILTDLIGIKSVVPMSILKTEASVFVTKRSSHLCH